MSKYRLKVLIVQMILIISFIVLWEISANNGWINPFIFSSPSQILNTLISLIKSGDLFIHIAVTLTEVIVAFLIGISTAFIISIIMYLNKFISDVIDPFLTMLNSLPKVALGPIIIIWAGANTKSIIAMALLINVIVSIITIYNGFKTTDEIKIKLFKSFKATKYQILTKLVIPSNTPSIISALKINISMTFIGVIMGEFLVSKKGIGYLILYGTQVFNLKLVLTGIIVLIIMSYSLYKIVNRAEKKLNI